MPDVTLDILKKARDYVKAGWTTGSLEIGNNVCAIGALGKALREENLLENSEMYNDTKVICLAGILAPYIDINDDDDYENMVEKVYDFNDMQEENSSGKKAVLAVFDQAIKNYKEKK